MSRKDEPAIKHYWFGKAYRDMWAAIKDSHRRNLDTTRTYWKKAGSGTGNDFERAVSTLFFVLLPRTVIVFGTARAILVPIHVAIVAILLLCIVITFLTLDIAERCYLLFKGWTTVCRHCGERVALPAFRCSGAACGEWHYNLRPSSYGIFKHQCKCC